MKYAIVAGGCINDKFALAEIKNGKYDITLAADSGMDFFYRVDLKPDIIIGDFDSVQSESLEYFKKQKDIRFEILNPIKDDTDTEHAIRYALAHGATEIVLLGATGGRIDHLLANISLLGIGLEKNVPIKLVDETNKVNMLQGPASFVVSNKDHEEKEQEKKNKNSNQLTNKKHYVSLIPYTTKVTGVTLSGFKYLLKDFEMSGFNSLGVSNEIVEKEGRISIKEGILLVIESQDA